MKTNLKKTIMAAAVLGSMTMPYLAKDAEAICLIACSKRNTSATNTTQTETNSVWSRMQGHTQNTYSSAYQSGDISVSNFGNYNTFGAGPEIFVKGDNNAAINAYQAHNVGIVNSNFGHSNTTAPQASGDVQSSIFPSNSALSRSSNPITGDRDSVDVKVK